MNRETFFNESNAGSSPKERREHQLERVPLLVVLCFIGGDFQTWIVRRPQDSSSSTNMAKWDLVKIRYLIAFWLLGLCNNYGYVIMLSAAEDIMDQQQHKTTNVTTNDKCEENVVSRECSSMSTGAVLLADNIPSVIVQATFPFFMHRIPFGLRHCIIVLLQVASYLTVAFSADVAMSLTGVVFAAFGCGMGEITFLSLASHYPTSAIAAWASGTGGAGVLGSFAYAALTEPSMGGLSPKNALLCMLVVPVIFFIAYWIILVIPNTVYSASWHPRTWIVPPPEDDNDEVEEDKPGLDNEGLDDSLADNASISNGTVINKGYVKRKNLTFLQKLALLPPILHLAIPLALVYIGEYVINQGLTELIFFNCSKGFNMSQSSQYRWYQVLYQVGVFISRSSVKIVELPLWLMYLLPVFQLSNMIFFFYEAMFWFVPHIAIIFALIIIEGLFGGSSYVNTYNKVYNQVQPDVREYCMSTVSIFYSLGVTFSGFISIPINNYICNKQVPHTMGWTTTMRPI